MKYVLKISPILFAINSLSASANNLEFDYANLEFDYANLELAESLLKKYNHNLDYNLRSSIKSFVCNSQVIQFFPNKFSEIFDLDKTPLSPEAWREQYCSDERTESSQIALSHELLQQATQQQINKWRKKVANYNKYGITCYAVQQENELEFLIYKNNKKVSLSNISIDSDNTRSMTSLESYIPKNKAYTQVTLQILDTSIPTSIEVSGSINGYHPVSCNYKIQSDRTRKRRNVGDCAVFRLDTFQKGIISQREFSFLEDFHQAPLFNIQSNQPKMTGSFHCNY
jgi:hypothetical protein